MLCTTRQREPARARNQAETRQGGTAQRYVCNVCGVMGEGAQAARVYVVTATAQATMQVLRRYVVKANTARNATMNNKINANNVVQVRRGSTRKGVARVGITR